MKLTRWIAARLNRKIIAAMVASLAVASLIFMTLFVLIYRNELIGERATAARQINSLLQISLENAMLKRDLDGLRKIVTRLGTENRIASVEILNPAGEVRFASDVKRLGGTMATTPGEVFISDDSGRDVLRSTNAVANREACAQCHGPATENPVNGVLVIDYDATTIRNDALRSAIAFSGAGLAVALIAGLGSWIALKRWVLTPAAVLTAASDRLAAGDLSSRSGMEGKDEFGDLAHSFDVMAERLQRAMADAKANEAFQQAIIDGLPDAMRVIGSDFKIIRANNAFFDLHGGDRETAAGCYCFAASHGRSEPCVASLEVCPIERFREGMPTEPLSFRARHRRANGAECLVEVRAAPIEIPREGGVEFGIVESIRDLEADITASHEEKLAELSMLAAGVAHEIRNPLGGMSFALSEAGAEIAAGDADRAQGHIALAHDEAERCLSFADSLLKLSTPASSTLDLINIGQAISETITLLAMEAEKGGVEIALDIAPDLRAQVSDGELRRIVVNLIQNAFHAMPKGGHLSVAARRRSKQIEIDFSDTGIGIALEDMSRIFQPFWSKRADAARGTGLGLTLCKTAVESWNGRIEFDSTPGKGTRVRVTLPCADSEDVHA